MKNEYCDLYLNYLKYEKKLSNNTIISYQMELEEFANFFNNKNLFKLQDQDLNKFLKYLDNDKGV